MHWGRTSNLIIRRTVSSLNAKRLRFSLYPCAGLTTILISILQVLLYGCFYDLPEVKMSTSKSRRDVSFSSISIDNGLHQSVALAAMTLLVTAHRAIMNTGFTLRRRDLPTDALIALTVGLISTIWISLVIVSGVFIGQPPCRNSIEGCLARLAYAPWMIQTLFVFWGVAFILELLRLKAKEHDSKSANADDAESRNAQSVRPALYRLLAKPGLQIWKMNCSRGPLDWSGSLDWKFRWALYITMAAAVGFTSFGAVVTGLYTIGLLNFVGLVLFIVGAGGANKYATAPHMYTADMLRVVLETRHREGTVYILPYSDRGFDAVWSPKIDYEYREVDEGSALSAHPQEIRAKKRGEFKKLDARLAAFNTATELTAKDVKDLATWLYTPKSAPAKMRSIACIRAPGIHLIARNLMIALWHAEYLIFMQRHLIEPDLSKLIGILRSSRGTGLDLEKGGRQIGNKPGLEGYQEAVRYVYSLFNESPDANALIPASTPPKTSEILTVCPDTIEDYVANLWDHCIGSQESTFAAMYAFCCYWEFDIGNDVANGWHGFPFRARDREGDMISWHVIWRQAWYGAVIAQLTSMSPIILSAFVAGILQ
jgi:hypothetical protein